MVPDPGHHFHNHIQPFRHHPGPARALRARPGDRNARYLLPLQWLIAAKRHV